MHYIFYGPEGSGKGTQAKLLSEKLNLPLFTSGDLVREAAKSDQGEVGKAARNALNEGKYVKDNIMFTLWENKLKTNQAKKGFILDGFPRNINQAKFVTEKTEENRYKIDKFIYLSLSDSEAIKRLAKRGRKLFEGSSINHDDPQRVKKRLQVYRKVEKEILNYYQGLGMLLSIDALGDINDVFQRITRGL